MPSQSSYYDIDAILAEEELVPCTTNFDFSFLGWLDPDLHGKSYLPEASRVKLPLWLLQAWATVGYVHLGLPRHFQRKARERLEAAPSRSHSEGEFSTGLCCFVAVYNASVCAFISRSISLYRSALSL
jgi:hypothetical protein